VVVAQTSAQQHIPILHPLESFLPWTPILDGTLVRGRTMCPGTAADGTQVVDQPLNLLKAGKARQIPVMLVRARSCTRHGAALTTSMQGSVTDETLMFVWQAWNKTVSKTEFDEIIIGIYHQHALGGPSRFAAADTTSS
jgi:hypothetical protein